MIEATKSAPLISVDWGTTNLRASLLDHSGKITDQLTSDRGLLNRPDNFQSYLGDLIQPWLTRFPSAKTVMSGMVGSPGGWLEVPHVPCPASPRSLATGARCIKNFGYGGAWILPGVAGRGAAGLHEVMRGEEVQFFGAQHICESRNLPQPQRWCFPGTHNKWIEPGQDLTRFSTSMVGEIFDLIQHHSLLQQSLAAAQVEARQDDSENLLRGLTVSQQPGGLMHHLFSVRTLQLSGAHEKHQGRSYLSGIIIGHDIAEQVSDADACIGIVASPALGNRYHLALTTLGYQCFVIDAQEATAQGAHMVAQHLTTRA